jgi:hypothetical protein
VAVVVEVEGAGEFVAQDGEDIDGEGVGSEDLERERQGIAGREQG